MIASLVMAAALLQSPDPVDRALIHEAVTPVMEAKRIPGVVVAVTLGDSLLLVEAFGVRDVATADPMQRDDRFLIGSITKQLTATLLAQLADRGVVALDDPVGRHLDPAHELPSWTERVTLRQLATHTAGLPREPVNRRNVPDSPSVMLPYSRGELYEGLERTALEAEPGTRWSYSNLGYAILGEALGRASGKGFEALLREHVLAPAGMEDTGITVAAGDEARFPSGYWPEDPQAIARPRWEFGDVAAFGGAFSTAEDLARFLAAQTASGDEAPYPAAVLATLHAPAPDVVTGPGRGMALGWFIQDLPGGLRVVGGGGEMDSYSGAVAFLHQPRVGIVVLANRGGDSGESVLRAVLERVLARLLSPA